MIQILTIVQIITAFLLIGAILMQQRGGGLSQIFGGGAGMYHTRRGMERTIFIATIILAILFLAGAALNIVIR
ncbi:MAG: preprotein translocase subunit SecG [Patescibacteria group bacterium]